MDDVLTFSDLLIFFPSIIALSAIIVFLPFLNYVLGRLILKWWPFRGLRLWAMSGIKLKKLPLYCPYDCLISDCRNWTCPLYSKNKVLRMQHGAESLNERSDCE